MTKQIKEPDVQLLVGRTIVAAYQEPPNGDEWELYSKTLTLTLDDGSTWEFSGYGYDASGLEIDRTSPGDAKAPTSAPQ